MRVLFYTRRGTTDWWRYIAGRMTCASKTIIMSELRGEGDRSIADSFYHHLRGGRSAECAVERFGTQCCNDIIARCRLLRSLERARAIEMIGAVAEACVEVLDEFRPDVFVATRIDSYVLDVLDRLLASRGIRYAGLWKAAILSDMVFFTSRGEHIKLRDPSDDEMEAAIAAITHEKFQATSLRRGAKYGMGAFLRKRLYYLARDNIVNVQRYLRRDPLGYRYLTTGKTVQDYSVRLRDWRVVQSTCQDWRARFEATPADRRVFVGLQVNPESTIDYYVRNIEMIDCTAVLSRVLRSLHGGGYRVFLKDHPNMFGMRRNKFYRMLAQHGDPVFVPYDVPSNSLIDESAATFTWSGTIGLQAAMAGRCAVVIQPTYLIDGPFLQISSLAEADTLASRIAAFQLPDNLAAVRNQLVRHVLSSFVPGSMNWVSFRQGNRRAIEGTDALVASLDVYLPKFAGR